MCQELQPREADTWSLLSWSLYISQTYVFFRQIIPDYRNC